MQIHVRICERNQRQGSGFEQRPTQAQLKETKVKRGKGAADKQLTVGNPNSLQRQIKKCLLFVNVVGDIYERSADSFDHTHRPATHRGCTSRHTMRGPNGIQYPPPQIR